MKHMVLFKVQEWWCSHLEPVCNVHLRYLVAFFRTHSISRLHTYTILTFLFFFFSLLRNTIFPSFILSSISVCLKSCSFLVVMIFSASTLQQTPNCHRLVEASLRNRYR
ncbi:hypothetical protein BDF20DRAFT_859986 [Mycotypha africana]|uniref:uncharacterized protein n=1 Tax=Mycotypha africana TaxID=64632 RepID=UPI0022FFD152|nr:uncharacterized protein BDF20DRAFT_859986 [Mycotypha africana]KAI8984431.1 hypothetical protein BDF20DRAFT_859986 [Mycotypha africana]